jgi:hypothetical protein
MPADQTHSNSVLNTRLSAPYYNTWCKIQVMIPEVPGHGCNMAQKRQIDPDKKIFYDISLTLEESARIPP